MERKEEMGMGRKNWKRGEEGTTKAEEFISRSSSTQTHHFLKMQSDWIQYLHNNRSSPTISHSFIQPAQACFRSTFLLTLLLVYFCRGSSSQMFKVAIAIHTACSRWWNRSSMSAILTVIDATSFLVFYFYEFTLCVSLPLFFFTLMLLSMIEFRLHKNYIWCCFSLSYLIELVLLRRKKATSLFLR